MTTGNWYYGQYFNWGEGTLAHLIDFAVVVIIVPDAKHALDIVPNGSPKFGRVHICAASHRKVRQIVYGTEFVVQQITDIVVQSIYQRVAVIVPRVVLNAKCARYVFRIAASLEILVREGRILDQVTDDRRRFDANSRRRRADIRCWRCLTDG